ncbi:DUF547 domain-containing protein [Kordiimonas gwangyangensis]|uniref:DUF547 domain-containing protein n=1 Tax=Kordiimonas gwangyangensis TaxID=288022 RepID=UPI00037C237A|nr:DUF547 domain-containing protein [Kordiimonas gwangyangensis]
MFHRTRIARIISVSAITLALTSINATAASTGAYFMADPTPAAEKADDFAYPYWDYILRTTVISPGMSDRTSNPVTIKVDNSRFHWGNKNPTAIEGNRIYLGAFEGENLNTLIQIRERMEGLPITNPMDTWTPDERLAYWLNLYNIAMVEQLAKHYPKRILKDLLYGEEALLDQKVLKVGGVPLSLNDIHHRIVLAKWDNPLVMYGFFHGYVGSPNIRREAYKPETVWSQLHQNAVEFINSNRGAKVRGGKLRVSELYRINAALFPNFDRDVKKHVIEYLQPGYAALAENSRSVVAETDDYYTTDIEMGITFDHQKGDDMLEDTALALLGRETLSVAVRNGWPSHVGVYMREVNRKHEREFRRNPSANTNVTVDELPQDSGTDSEN